jgi:hypothetical protein
MIALFIKIAELPSVRQIEMTLSKNLRNAMTTCVSKHEDEVSFLKTNLTHESHDVRRSM